MKTKDVDQLVSIVKTLCRELEEPWAIGRFHYLMMGLIELAREGKPWKALDVAFETSAFLCEMAERAEKEQKAQKAQAGTSIGIGTVAPAWNLGVERMRIHSDGYVQIRPDAPKPVATVEQMRAAADAAMASDDEMDEYECDSCHKVTLVPMDSGTPKGWQPSDNPDGEEYICNECHNFGPKHGSDAPQKYVCGWCNSTTESRVFPPPGWKETDDNEVICFACAEEEAKP